MRRWFVVMLAGILTGCAGDAMTRLDEEVSRMIQQRQQATLGEAAPRDPQPTPPLPKEDPNSDAAYLTTPSTVNPSAAELPAELDPHPAPLGDLGDTAAESQGQVTTFTLEAALAYAIQNSREYRNRKEELFLAAIDLLVERHAFSPRFFNVTSSTLSGTPEAGDYDQVFDLVNELGLRQRLPYGGEITASAIVSFTSLLQRGAGSTLEDGQTASVGLAAVLPLLRGAGQVARESLIQAERDLIYEARQFEDFRRQFFVDISTDYFDLLRQMSEIRNLEQQLENLHTLSDRFRALAEAGREPYFEVERSQQQSLFALNNLVNARERLEGSLDAFKIRLGMPVPERLAVKELTLIIPQPKLDAKAALETALALRLDVQTSRDRVQDAQRRVAVARNELLPDLDVTASVDVPTESRLRLDGGRLDAGEGSYSTSVRLSAPLDRRVEELNERRALVGLEQAQRSDSLLGDEVARDVRRSLRGIDQARATVSLQEQNLKLAERRLEGVKLRERDLGPRDVIEALDDLIEAQNRRDLAERNLRVSVLDYLLQTGQMRVTADGRWQSPVKLLPGGPTIVDTPDE